MSNNSLKKNYNKYAIHSIIENTKEAEKPIMGWKIIAGKKVTVNVIFHIIRKFRNEVVVRAVSDQAKNSLGSLAAGAEKLNFYLPEDLVLFQTTVKSLEENGDIVIEIPEFIAQVDRRKDLRLFLDNGIKIPISFDKQNHGQRVTTQKFNKMCFDISSGGLSFIVSKTESKFFMIDDEIFIESLEIDSNIIKLKAKIVNILDVEPNSHNQLMYKGKKICLKYTKISNRSKEILNDYVFRFVDFDDAI